MQSPEEFREVYKKLEKVINESTEKIEFEIKNRKKFKLPWQNKREELKTDTLHFQKVRAAEEKDHVERHIKRLEYIRMVREYENSSRRSEK